MRDGNIPIRLVTAFTDRASRFGIIRAAKPPFWQGDAMRTNPWVLAVLLAAISGKMVKQSPESMKIRTPSAIMGVRGTEFVVQVDEPVKPQ
jgi:hypothetical protein